MKMLRSVLLGTLVWLAAIASVHGAPIVVGQVDTFEDGTTSGWTVGLLGAVSPAPPANISTGGPAGVDDNFLQLTSLGVPGAGGRLTALNFDQWAGDYGAAGVAAITMDLRNLGATDVRVRLFLENPAGAPPTDGAITHEVLLPAGGGWTRAAFRVGAGALTPLFGDVGTLLSNVTTLRIFHAADAAPVTFPGPASVAQLGIDNISAAAVPEPIGLALVGLAAAAAEAHRRRAR
jgi:hypothetical protein